LALRRRGPGPGKRVGTALEHVLSSVEVEKMLEDGMRELSDQLQQGIELFVERIS
jgi:hypothetical protein